jgi:hypothetical protein
MDCFQRVKKGQYTFEKFLRYGHHVELIEIESIVEVDDENGLVRAGPKVRKVHLADAKCPALGQLGLPWQNPGPARLPCPRPNYKHPYLIPAVKMAITWLLGKAIVELMDRIRKEEYDGRLPFVPMKYGLLVNSCNDKMFCAMPITTYGNSIVDKDQALALRVSELHLLFIFD